MEKMECTLVFSSFAEMRTRKQRRAFFQISFRFDFKLRVNYAILRAKPCMQLCALWFAVKMDANGSAGDIADVQFNFLFSLFITDFAYDAIVKFTIKSSSDV